MTQQKKPAKSFEDQWLFIKGSPRIVLFVAFGSLHGKCDAVQRFEQAIQLQGLVGRPLRGDIR